MRNFLVFDIDQDVTARFRERASAVRFARWLARNRDQTASVLVTDEARCGEIVWPEPVSEELAPAMH